MIMASSFAQESFFDQDPKTGTYFTTDVIDKIIILDVKTDTVLKEFEGKFGPIARNLKLHWE